MRLRKDERKIIVEFIEIIENDELHKKGFNYNKLSKSLDKLINYYDETMMISKNLNRFLNYTRKNISDEERGKYENNNI